MRRALFFVLLSMNIICVFAAQPFIIYKLGYLGANIELDDSIQKCKFTHDTIFNSIRIIKKNSVFSMNNVLFEGNKVEKLNEFVEKNIEKIIVLENELNESFKCKFVPPSPICYLFESFSIRYKNKEHRFTLINREMNLLGKFLKEDEIKIFVDMLDVVSSEFNEEYLIKVEMTNK